MPHNSSKLRGTPDSSAVERKRKLPPPTAVGDVVASSKQQSISDLFAGTQSKPSSKNSVCRPLSPTSKRIKLDDSDPTGLQNPPPPVVPLHRDKMYSFPAKNKTNNGFIDLTNSPQSSPQKANGVRTNRLNINAQAGAKKLVVKNFRTQNKFDPEKYFEQEWKRLNDALAVIFSNGKINFSLEELYRGVENLCKQGRGPDLCIRLQERCQESLEKNLKEPLLAKTSAANVDILRAVLSTWAIWNGQLKPINWIFCYLDRAYLLPQGRSLQEISISLYRGTIFEDPSLRDRIIQGICDLVSQDREAEFKDKSIFRDAIQMLNDLIVYTNVFEPSFLAASQAYIVDWAKSASLEMSLADYVKSAFKLMEREVSRCEIFKLASTTRRDLLKLLEYYLIEDKNDRLVNQDDVADLLDADLIDELKALYNLLNVRKLGVKVRPAFEKWIEDTGTSIVFDEKEEESMVIKLLGLKRKLDTIWRVAFQRDDSIGHGLRESFESFINKTKRSSATWNTDNSKPGEMIAKYVDQLLRGGAKAIPVELSSSAKNVQGEEENEDIVYDEDSEVNNQLDQVLDLFRFVHGKAVFEAFYKKDLARRLLMGRSASADAERSMLTRLKTECGAGFTQNLEQMFKDVELSREEMSSYKSIMAERQEDMSLDVSVNILSASAWPSYPDIPVIIPQNVKSALDKFEAHYKSKHSNRKLDWKHALAHCQVKASFPKGNKELVVSSFQAIVLLLFNDFKNDEKVSYEYIKEATGLPPNELERTLQSLACARIRPLTKHPKSRDVNPTDTFTLNANFTDPKYRIKINAIQLKETPQENKETHERVQEDRNFECQAAIVRILKSRKRIRHAELIAETITATKKRGVLAPADIKRNIDRLIEKEYCEREEDGWYSYLA